MLFLLIIAAMVSVYPHEWFLNHRVNLGIPVSILDFAVVFGVFWALLPWRSRSYWTCVHPHHGMTILLGLYIFVTVIGFFSGVVHDNPWYGLISDTRDWVYIPLTAFATYRLIANPYSLKRLLWLMVFLGAGTGALIFANFVILGQEATVITDVGRLRENRYGVDWAVITGIFCFVLAWSPHIKSLPRGITFTLAALGTGGAFMSLNRSNWLALIFTFFAAFLILPQGQRLRQFVLSIAGGIVIIAVVFLAVALAGSMTNHDLVSPILERAYSLLPGSAERGAASNQAWDTRLPGIQEELSLWLRRPLTGFGFGFAVGSESTLGISYKHCVYSNALAQAGPLNLFTLLFSIFLIAKISWITFRHASANLFLLVGIFGFLAAIDQVAIGGMTMSFNNIKGAPLFGMLIGLTFRAYDLNVMAWQQQQSAVRTS